MFLIWILFFGFISNLDGCCRRAKRVCTQIYDSLNINNVDYNPEGRLDPRLTLPLHRQDTRLFQLAVSDHKSEKVFCFGAGAIFGSVVTLTMQKLLTTFQD